ncbi:hypothetical protein XENORESO_004054 [Xenotaenia resolanae]|uniref:Uncharacterized protein n=1 Tax=Xenotaenia resolanae TaxID=208358 RepID=A0ABV0W6J2_9TELE
MRYRSTNCSPAFWSHAKDAFSCDDAVSRCLHSFTDRLNWDLPAKPCSGAQFSQGCLHLAPTVNDKAKVSACARSRDLTRITAAPDGAPERMIESALQAGR